MIEAVLGLPIGSRLVDILVDRSIVAPMEHELMALDAEGGDVRRKRSRRPSREGESRTGARERMIRCGIELLTERGFNGIGIEDVLSAANVPKGSFYHYFKSKHAFGEMVIDGYASYFNRKLDRILNDNEGTPLSRLQAFVAEASEGMARYAFRRGCLIGNMGQELGGLNDVFRGRIEAVLQSWQTRVAICLARAQQVGEIASDQDVHALAEFFWIGWEGAILRAKLARSVVPLERFAQLFFSRVCV